jgi:hypothetical protein
MVEGDIAGIAILDPMQVPETAAQQKSVDRARAQSMNIMNRCINALRKLQTERGIRSQAVPETDVPAGLGLMDLRQVAKTKPRDTDAEPETAPAAHTPCSPKHVSDLIRTETQSQTSNQWSMGSNCKPAAAPAKSAAPPRITPRNAPCPCNSGQKFKCCYGNPLAAGQRKAA